MGRFSHILAMPGPDFEPPPLDWRKFDDPCRDEITLEPPLTTDLCVVKFKDVWNFEVLAHRKKHGAR